MAIERVIRASVADRLAGRQWSKEVPSSRGWGAEVLRPI
jgi:hypothetical protein